MRNGRLGTKQRVPWASFPCGPQVFTPAPLSMETQVGGGRPGRPTSNPTQAHVCGLRPKCGPHRPLGPARASGAAVHSEKKAASPLTSPLQASWAPRGHRRGLNGCTCGRLDADCVRGAGPTTNSTRRRGPPANQRPCARLPAPRRPAHSQPLMRPRPAPSGLSAARPVRPAEAG